MSDKMRLLWILLPLIAQGDCSDDNFKTLPQALSVVHVGDSVVLECVLNEAATCAWKLEGTGLADGFLNQNMPSNLPITARDTSLQSTDCTITLDNVDERFNGKYLCSPFLKQGQTDSLPAEVIIARKPDTVELLGDAADVFSLTASAEEPTTVSCRATNARPKADIAWYIGNTQVYEGIDVEVQETDDGLMTTVSVLTHQFNKEDNGARLRCVANHAGYEDTDLREDAVLVDVQFIPYRPEGNKVGTIYGFTEQQEGQVTINFTANPLPQRVTWRVGDDTMVPVGGQSLDQRFTSSQLETVNATLGMYAVTLTINPVLLEDQSKEFLLRLENAVGHEEIQFAIGTGAAPPPPAMSAGTIVLIVIIALVLVLLVAGLVVCKRGGKLCFAGKDVGVQAPARPQKRRRSAASVASGTDGAGGARPRQRGLLGGLPMSYQQLKQSLSARPSRQRAARPEREEVTYANEAPPPAEADPELDLAPQTAAGPPAPSAADSAEPPALPPHAAASTPPPVEIADLEAEPRPALATSAARGLDLGDLKTMPQTPPTPISPIVFPTAQASLVRAQPPRGRPAPLAGASQLSHDPQSWRDSSPFAVSGVPPSSPATPPAYAPVGPPWAGPAAHYTTAPSVELPLAGSREELGIPYPPAGAAAGRQPPPLPPKGRPKSQVPPGAVRVVSGDMQAELMARFPSTPNLPDGHVDTRVSMV